jgi:galactitol-specific phosphotransferase system IIB component
MIEMNIRKILKEMKIKGIGVNHSQISKIENHKADVYIITKDLENKVDWNGRVIVLKSMLDREELRKKVLEVFKEFNIV